MKKHRALPGQVSFNFDKTPDGALSPSDIFSAMNGSNLTRFSEDRRLERKRATFAGESLARYFSMWANTSPDGGIILVGVEDSGEISGCASLSQDQINRIHKTDHVYCPDARAEFKTIQAANSRGEPDFVIAIRVRYNQTSVVKLTNGKAYIRKGDDCIELTADEIRELAADKGQVSFEDESCQLKYPDDFDLNAVRTWTSAVREKMSSGQELSDTEILANRHLGRLEPGLFIANNACALLFAKDPRGLFPGSRVRFLRFEGDSEATGAGFNAVKDLWAEGTIPEIIKEASRITEQQLRTFSPLNADTKFELIEEYPKDAWYEAIVNACVHRSYGNGMKNMTVFVRMFDDRLEIESPGPFPPFVTAQNIYDMHKPRNPRIMEALYFLGTVKMNHEGTRRMRDLMKGAELPEPHFSQEQIAHALVKVTLKNNIYVRKIWIDRDVSKIVGKALAASLSAEEKRVLNFVAERGMIQINDVVRMLGPSWSGADRILKGLWRKRILQYIRFRPYEKNKRDPKAYFRLRSEAPLPENAHEPSDR